MVADVMEAKNEEDFRSKGQKYLGAVIDNIKSARYLQGLDNLSKIVSNPFGPETTQALHSAVGSLVPAGIASIERGTDPYFREAKTFPEAVQARIPKIPGLWGGATNLPAKTSITGEEVQRPGNFVSRIASPVAVSSIVPGADIQQELIRLRVPLKPPSRDFRMPTGEVRRLDNDEFSLIQEAYQHAANQVEKLMNSASYDRLPDTIAEGGEESKEYLIRKIYEKQRNSARNRLFAYLRVNRKPTRFERQQAFEAKQNG
jgi:hypothetical protein